jgi:hypothetical protein
MDRFPGPRMKKPQDFLLLLSLIEEQAAGQRHCGENSVRKEVETYSASRVCRT